jgi:hypothetical protein
MMIFNWKFEDLLYNGKFWLDILMTWYIMTDFGPILVLSILAKIHGPHNMGCAFWSNLWIDAGIMLQFILFTNGFIKIMHCKMHVDE